MKKNKNKKNPKITKKTTFTEIIEKFPELVETLSEKGMHCIGCPMAMQETLEQGILAHGINPEKLIKELNEKLSKKNKS